MSHLEALIGEYLDWRGFLVRRNTKVGRLKHGGWEMELDIVGYHPKSGELVHYEPSIDAIGWQKREARYRKKFDAGRKYILSEMFSWLPPTTPIMQFAAFVDHPRNRHELAGGTIISIDELMAQIRTHVKSCGIMARNAIPEQYPMLRTLQLSLIGYYKVVPDGD